MAQQLETLTALAGIWVRFLHYMVAHTQLQGI